MRKESPSRNKREKHTDYNATSHMRDVNGHEIFKNNRLTSQFLSNYTGIQMLAGVRPEDIEDVSERYHAFLGIEFESDTIKKVCLHRADDTPAFKRSDRIRGRNERIHTGFSVPCSQCVAIYE